MSLLTTYAQNVQQQETVDPAQIKDKLKEKMISGLSSTYSAVYTKVTGVSAEEKEAALKVSKGTSTKNPDEEAVVPKTGFDLITKLTVHLGEQLGIANEVTSVLAPLAKNLYQVTESPLLATLAGGLIEKGYKQEIDQRAKLIQKANAVLEGIKATSIYIGSIVGHWFDIAKEHIIEISQHFISSVDDFFANVLTNTGPLAPIMKIMYPYVKSFALSTFKVSKTLISGVFSKIGKELFGTVFAKFLKPKNEDKLKTITGKVMSIEKTLQSINQGINFLHESGLVEVPEQLRKGIQTAVEASKDPIKAFNDALDKFSKSENEKVANAAFKLKEIVSNKKFKAVAAITGLGAFVGAATLNTEESNKQEDIRKQEKQKIEEKQITALEGIKSGIQDLKSAFSKEVNYSDEVQKKKKDTSSGLHKLLTKFLSKQNSARLHLITNGVKKVFKNTFGYILNLGKALLGGLVSTIAQHPILSLIFGGAALSFDWIKDLSKVAAVGQGILKFTSIGSKFKDIAVIGKIASALAPIAKIITPIANVIGKVMSFLSKIPIIGSVLSKFFPLLGRLVPGLGWIMLAFDAIKGISWVVDKFKEYKNPLGEIIDRVGEKIKGFFNELSLFVSDPLGYIAMSLGIDLPEFKPMDILLNLLSVLNPFALAFKLLPDKFKDYITNLLNVVKKKLINALKYIPFVGDKLKKYFEEKMKKDEERVKTSQIPKPQLVSPTVQPVVTQSSFFNRQPAKNTYMQKILKSRTSVSSNEIPKEIQKGNTKDKLLAMLRKSETGSFKGDYSSTHDLGDKGGITFGAYQLTESSGTLEKFITEYTARSNDKSLQKIFNLYKQGRVHKRAMMEMLKRVGSTDIGKQVQDEIAYNEYVLPAIKLAAKKGITDPKAIAMIIDHTLNAGISGANEMLQYVKEATPEGIAKARKEHYKRIAIRTHKGRFYKGWLNRVDQNLSTTNALFKDTEQHAQNSKSTAKTPKKISTDAISKYIDKLKLHASNYDTDALIYMRDIITEIKNVLPEDSDLYDDVEDLADTLKSSVQVTQHKVSVQLSEDDIKKVVSKFDSIMKRIRSSDKWNETYETLRSAELIPAQTSAERFEEIVKLSESSHGRIILKNLYGTGFINPYSSLAVRTVGNRLSESVFVTQGESLPINKFVDTVPLNEYGEVLRELDSIDSPDAQKIRDKLLTDMQMFADTPLSKADPELAKTLKQMFKGDSFSTLQVTSNMARVANLPEQFTHHEITPDELKTLSDKQLVIHKIRSAKTPEELNELVQKFWPGYASPETIKALPESERDKLKQTLINRIENADYNARFFPDEKARATFSQTSRAIKPYASRLRATVNKNVSDMQHKAQEKAINEKQMQKEAVKQGVKEATTNNTNAAIVNTNRTSVNPTIVNNNTIVNNSSVNNSTVHANSKPPITVSE